MAANQLLLLIFLTGYIPAVFGAACSIGNQREPTSDGHGPARLTANTQDPCECSAFYLGGVNVLKAGQQVLGTTDINEMVIGNDADEIRTSFKCPEPCDVQPLGVGKNYLAGPASVFDQKATSIRLNDHMRICLPNAQPVDLGKPERVTGVWLQFEKQTYIPVSSYWLVYREHYTDEPTVVNIPSVDETASRLNNTHQILLDEVIKARYLEWQSDVTYSSCFLFDLLGCKALCQNPLGLSDGFIPDANIYISHGEAVDFGPEQARPVAVGENDGGQMWCAGERGTDVDWIQVDLNFFTTVSGVRVENMTDWSITDDLFIGYRVEGGPWSTIHKFLHQYDAEYFPQPVVAYQVRINIDRVPNKDVCLRFELLGCRDCRDPLGMADSSIPDSAITVSSVRSDDFGPEFARLNVRTAWCASDSDDYPWIRVNFERYLPVSGVITQGATCCQHWVQRFKVEYEDAVSGALTSTGEEFVGNTDPTTEVTNIFYQPIVARYVQIVALRWYGQPCLRLELLGCKGCNGTLGMEDNSIGDENISASSSKIQWTDPIGDIRLGQSGPQDWLDTRYRRWVLIDLGRATVVSGMTLYYPPQWTDRKTISCILKYAMDPSQLTYYLDERNRTMYFKATHDKAEVTPFKYALYTRFVILVSYKYMYPDFHELALPNLQIELWGCRGRCEDKLGVEDGTVPDDRLTASSEIADHWAHSVRLYSYHGWSPLSTDSRPWIQVNLGSDTVVSGVITRGGWLYQDSTDHQWVETYKVVYSNGWLETTVADSMHDLTGERGVTQVFSANFDGDTPVTNLFSQPISAGLVRIVPLSWRLAISMRLELLGCPSFCQERLGLENGQISDHQISSSGSWDSLTHGPQRARLNQKADPELGLAGGWRAEADGPTTGETWIQVDFAQWTNLTGVITQGREDKSQWVKTFKVSYLQNDWYYVKTHGDAHQPQEFVGNYDNYHLVTNFFLHQVVARSARVYPIIWYVQPSMRLELLGCTVRCQSKLGMEDGTIPDTAINASTSLLTKGFRPYQVRLTGHAFHLLYFFGREEEMWIQVDLGEKTQVSGIILQQNRLVSSLHLKYSISGDLMTWEPILNSDKTEMFPPREQLEALHARPYGEQNTSFFYNSIFARFIRLIVVHDVYIPNEYTFASFDFIGCRNHPRTTRTCQTLFSDGYLLDGTYQIDMDGIEQGQPPFQVNCSMSDGVTIINHDTEDEIKITGTPGQVKEMAITYSIDLEKIISVIDNSLTCKQTVKVKCGVHVTDSSTPLEQPALQPVKWVSRSGEEMLNWGVPTGHTGCICGLNQGCNTAGELCNCGVWFPQSSPAYNEGILTDKVTLPVKALIITYASQDMYITVGPLKCKWPHYSLELPY